MAAARNATNSTTTPKNGRGASRLSFAKISDTLTVPDLLALQTESFDWLVGNDAWKARVAEAKEAGRTDVPETSGLEEIFEEISPIEDLGETMQLSFTNPYLEPEKYSIEECKECGKTYAAPLYVEAEFMNHLTGEIKTQTVFMGDFPLQTGKGTFIINGTERVVVSQLVRSPGVYFDKTPDKTSDKDIVSARVIPSRGAWLEFEIDKNDHVAVRVDRKRKQDITVFLLALGLDESEIREEFKDYPALTSALELGLAHLSLDRPAPTLSAGELQRIHVHRIDRAPATKTPGVRLRFRTRLAPAPQEQNTRQRSRRKRNDDIEANRQKQRFPGNGDVGHAEQERDDRLAEEERDVGDRAARALTDRGLHDRAQQHEDDRQDDGRCQKKRHDIQRTLDETGIGRAYADGFGSCGGSVLQNGNNGVQISLRNKTMDVLHFFNLCNRYIGQYSRDF